MTIRTPPAPASAVPLCTADGVDLAWHVRVAERTVRGVAVIVHGFAAHKRDPGVARVEDALADAGLHVVVYDGRGHGSSAGLCTLGDLERHDVEAAVTAARDLDERVVLVGSSMGAIASLRYAAADPRLSGVVSVSSPSHWRVPGSPRTMLLAALTQTRPGRWIARRMGVRLSASWTSPLPPADLAARIVAPLAIIHGRVDRYVPVRDALELRQAAAASARLEVVPGMGHGFDEASVPAVLRSVDWALADR